MERLTSSISMPWKLRLADYRGKGLMSRYNQNNRRTRHDLTSKGHQSLSRWVGAVLLAGQPSPTCRGRYEVSSVGYIQCKARCRRLPREKRKRTTSKLSAQVHRNLKR